MIVLRRGCRSGQKRSRSPSEPTCNALNNALPTVGVFLVLNERGWVVDNPFYYASLRRGDVNRARLATMLGIVNTQVN